MKRFFPRPWLAGLLCALALPAWAAFTDNGDGTITDTTTGLVWDKCSRGQVWDNTTPPGTCTGAASTHAWAAALAEAAVANAASHRGHADWRLPNRTELESLVKIDASALAIDGTVFPATASAWYWTSTTYAPNPAVAWGVGFSFGLPYADSKTDANRVRLVRSGQWFGALDALAATAPVLSALGVVGTTPTATTLQATSNEAATGYWIAVPQGSTAPTAAQVKAGVGYGAVTVAAAGNGAMAAAVQASFAITGLTASTAYTLYLVAEDGDANLSTPPGSIDVTTAGTLVNGACGSAHNLGATPLLASAPSASLCGTGTASAVTGGTSTWAWSCTGSGGGSTAACQAPRGYTVTPTAGAGGSLSPATAQTVAYNATPSFAITPDAGHVVASASGCGGNLAGNTFTTAPVTAHCTVSASFTPPVVVPGLTVPEGAQAGQPLGLALQAGNGWQVALASTHTVASLGAPALPPGVTLLHGVVRLRLNQGTQGSEATVVLTYPQPLPPGARYYKYGRTRDNNVPHWYVFPGAQISGSTVTLTLKDGWAGDDDVTENSVIDDPGGVGLGGAAASIPTLGEWALVLLAGVLGLLSAGALRRREARG